MACERICFSSSYEKTFKWFITATSNPASLNVDAAFYGPSTFYTDIISVISVRIIILGLEL